MMILNTVRVGCRRGFLAAAQTCIQPHAGIKGKYARIESGMPPRPPPYPYKNKKYNYWHYLFDKTSHRFDENTAIIVVEGNVATGKTAFAKALAEDLDMKYLRAVTAADNYLTEYGYDLRQLDSQLPLDAQSFDEERFLQNPNHRNTAGMQIILMRLKYMQLVDAICHMMNTGQGVVIERSFFSDQAFLEAMYKMGYISSGARDVYYQIYKEIIIMIKRPHLVIYLDVPVPKILENIKKRALPHEVNSKVLTPEYLGTIEKAYKEVILPDMEIHSELLVYDWSSPEADPEMVVEDIERIDFTRFGKHDKKLHDWRFYKEWDLCEKRIEYTSNRDDFDSYFDIPRIDVPELLICAEDGGLQDKVYASAPGQKYDYGFNKDMGDTNIHFKLAPYRHPSPWL